MLVVRRSSICLCAGEQLGAADHPNSLDMALPAVRAAVDSLAAGDEQPSRDALVATLSSVLEGPRRGQALIELCDMLGECAV